MKGTIPGAFLLGIKYAKTHGVDGITTSVDEFSCKDDFFVSMISAAKNKIIVVLMPRMKDFYEKKDDGSGRWWEE
jgi:hypothetical protein